MKTSQKFALCCWGLGICLLTQAASVRATDVGNPAAGAQTNRLNAMQTANKRIEMEGSVGGIGAKLAKTNSLLLIEKIYASSPAERAGLKAGAKIISINGLPTKNMSSDDAVKLLRGSVGTQVELEVEAADGRVTRLSLSREKIMLAPVESKLLEGGLVYLRIPAFNQETPNLVRQALAQKIGPDTKGIVLDFRNTGAGSLNAQAEVAGCFVPQGRTLWQVRDKAGRVRQISNNGTPVTDLPLAVLTGTNTCCGELIAAAMQSNQRGVVVGQHTVGYSTQSELVNNPDGSSRTEVRGSFLTATGKLISGAGITPDRLLPDSASDDDFLKAARESLAKSGDSPDAQPAATERLKKVKALYDQGLIPKEDYDRKVKEIMDSL
jgi:carboxyl-terminal processing protease